MDNKAVSKRKKDKHSDNEDNRREKKMSRRHRTRSRSREDRDREPRRKRRYSRSRSPNIPVKQEKRREDGPNDAEIKKKVPERKAKETDMLNTRTGGAYIPPARLRMMQAQITDKSSVAYQRLAWEALKKSIHGHINKINVGNIGIIIKELLKENIVRGRGLLCRSVIQAQAASPTFTNVYAALVAAVNSRFPNIGELLLKRLVIQFKRGFKRNDKPTCISSASFIAHLVNQRVAHEILALELLTLLVETPTDDSVEVAIAFLKECGQKLTEVSSKGVNAIFEMLRNILHEGQLDKRVQYMIEVMFQVWKDGFKDHPALIEELELVPEEEQFTHLLMLDDATDPQDILNVFKFDDKYEENEQKYKTLSKEILGSDAESGEEDGSEESGSGESEDEEEQEGEQKGITIIDNTETNLVALRRTIYLTINSSLDFEECAHKLMKMQLKPGQEVELCHMFLDCCAEQRTYEKFYGLLAQRFCNINRIYIGPFEEIFKDSYSTAHRLDTNRLRNVSKFFAHLLFTDSISWEVMECVKLNEEDTTSSSRIYIKILFQELAEYMGLKKLNDRLKDPTLQGAFSGIFPRDNPKNTRFSINFFTSIGLGGLTDELREHLKQMPKNIPAPVTDINVESESSSSSSSSSDSSSESSSSDSDEENDKNKNKKDNSMDKNKSKQNKNAHAEAEENNKDKNDKAERWGHDGFYETYGEDARRPNKRPERFEQNNSSNPRIRENQQDDDRGYRDERNNRDMNGRQNNRSIRNLDENRAQRNDSDNYRRKERERSYEKKRSNTKDDRYKRPVRLHADRDDKRKAEGSESRKDGHADDKDRYQQRDNSIKDKTNSARESNNKTREDNRYKDNGRNHERNTEKEKRQKGYDTNERIQMDDKNKDEENSRYRKAEREARNKIRDENYKERDDDKKTNKKSENLSSKKTKSRNGRREEESRATEKRNRNDGNNKSRDKHSESSNEEDSGGRQKGSKNKNNIKETERKIKETEEDSRRKGKSSNNNQTRNSEKEQNKKKIKKTSKKNSRKARDEESSSSESSSSDSSSSESSSSESNSEQTGGRYWDSFDIEKPNRDNEYIRTPEINEKRTDKRRDR